MKLTGATRTATRGSGEAFAVATARERAPLDATAAIAALGGAGPALADTGEAPGRTLEETRRELTGMAARRAGRVPVDWVVEHVLRVTAGGDWPVRAAAMTAVLRRFELAERDGLRVGSRPAGGGLFGNFVTRARGSAMGPYRTRVSSTVRLDASCDCRDFLKNGLGVCKHVLAVVSDLARSTRKWARATADVRGAVRPTVTWDPVRPFNGAGDWMAQLRLADGVGAERLPRVVGSAVRSAAGELDGTPRRRVGGRRGGRAAPREVADTRRRAVDALAAQFEEHGDAADPAVAALVAMERARLAAVPAARLGRAAVARAMRTIKVRLYPYQREGVDRFLATGRLLLADDMGLGKTIQSAAACHVLWKAGLVKRGLLVVPASLKPQWLREWNLVTDAPLTLVEGSQAERAALYGSTKTGFLMANYEQVLRDLGAMSGWAPDLVVLDEAQRIKNWATKTAGAVKRLQPTYRLVLTGTPLENRLDELASILEWVDERAIEPRWRLVPWHTQTADGTGPPSGARNLATLRERLAPCMLRRRREDVLTQLPSRTDTVVPAEFTDEQRTQHDEYTPLILQILARARRRPLTQAEFLRLMSYLTTQRIISNGMAQFSFKDAWKDLAKVRHPDAAFLRGLSSPKLLELREILAQIVVAQGRKVVVFSQWRRMLALAHWAVSGLLEEHGLRAVFFTGEEGQARRTQNLIDLHDDPSVRVLFATDAGGVGLNLQRAASCCVNLEIPWNPAVLEQRIGRVHRMGQKSPVDVYNVITEGSIESRIAAGVADKRALFRGLFDGTTEDVVFERAASFLSRVETICAPGGGGAPRLSDAASAGVETGDVVAASAAHALDDDSPRDGAATRGDDDSIEGGAAAEAAVAAQVLAADEGGERVTAASGAVPGGGSFGGDVSRLCIAPTTDPAAPVPGVAASNGAPSGVSDASSSTASNAAPGVPRPGGALDLAGAFGQMTVSATADGGLRIDAPPAAAALLASFFDGFAAALRGGARPPAG